MKDLASCKEISEAVRKALETAGCFVSDVIVIGCDQTGDGLARTEILVEAIYNGCSEEHKEDVA